MHRIPFEIDKIAKLKGLEPKDVGVMVTSDLNFVAFNIKAGLDNPVILGQVYIEPLFAQREMINLTSEMLNSNVSEIKNITEGYLKEIGNRLAEIELINRTDQEEIEFNELKLSELDFNKTISGMESANKVFLNTMIKEMSDNDRDICLFIKNFYKEIDKTKEYLKSKLLNPEQRTALNKLINTSNPKHSTFIDSKNTNDYEKIAVWRTLVEQNEMIKDFLNTKLQSK